MRKMFLVATAASALLSFAGLANARAREPAAMDRDGGHSGVMHEGRYVDAPRWHGPNIFAPFAHRHYHHRWWSHGRWYYR